MKNFENKFERNNFNKEVNTVNETVVATAEVDNAAIEVAKTEGMSTKKKVIIGTGVVGGVALLTYVGIKIRKWWKNRNKGEQPVVEETKKGDEFPDVK